MPQTAFSCDFYFDTNSVRALATWDRSRFGRLARAVERRHLRGGWHPWVVLEVAGTNLWRKTLTASDLESIQKSVQRYDVIVQRRVLYDYTEYLRRDAYKIANRPPPPPDVTRPARRRRTLDYLRQLTSPSQVVVQQGRPMTVTYLKPNGSLLEQFGVPRGWTSLAEGQIAGWPPLEKGRTKPVHRFESACEPFMRWVAGAAKHLRLPDEVRSALTDSRNAESLIHSSWCTGLLEALYYATRVAEKTTPEENDGADVDIAGFVFMCRRFVTGDTWFTRLVRSYVETPGAVMSLEEFEAEALG